jgi:hypothetical protein
VVHNVVEEPINAGDVFINLMEDDLVKAHRKNYHYTTSCGQRCGRNYPTTRPRKKNYSERDYHHIHGFQNDWREGAELVLSNSRAHVAVPFYLTYEPH